MRVAHRQTDDTLHGLTERLQCLKVKLELSGVHALDRLIDETDYLFTIIEHE